VLQLTEKEKERERERERRVYNLLYFHISSLTITWISLTVRVVRVSPRDVSRLGESYATSPFLALLEIRVKEDKILLSSMNLDF